MSDDVSRALIVVGFLLVLGALLWRYFSRRHALRRLVDRLGAAEPQERARSGILLVDLGLSRVARPLLAHVATEDDPRVRLAIALAVGRRQWEPSGTPRVERLREWAGLELEQQDQPVDSFGPAVTRLSDMGGPRPPDAEAGIAEAVISEPGMSAPGVAKDGAEPSLRWDPEGGADTA